MEKTKEQKEKSRVTISSIIAAIVLTAFKLIIGLMTGSLGILSEAMHSGLDLVAAVMTYFAVRMADHPPDEDHPYGHGKIENLSALFETLLLIITCFWIIYEAIYRLSHKEVGLEVNFWSFTVIITSIVIDFSRSRALMKIAKKYNSQAIKADALHFSTDILSSAVVLLGLIGSFFGYHQADSYSALIVGLIVIHISYKLGKESVLTLIDTKPSINLNHIISLSKEFDLISYVHDLKVRSAGSQLFIELNIHVPPKITVDQAHNVAHLYESKILKEYPKSLVHIHIEPEEKLTKSENL